MSVRGSELLWLLTVAAVISKASKLDVLKNYIKKYFHKLAVNK